MKSSSLPERLVVDATAIIAAISGGKALRIFQERPDIEFVTTRYTLQEVGFWITNLVAQRGIEREGFDQALKMLPLTVCERERYAHRIPDAQRRIRDANDVELLALHLELKAPIWSNDNVFRDSRFEAYPTGLLLRALEADQP